MSSHALPNPASAPRWWIYQRERFPVFNHGALIAAFSLSAVCYSALLRGSTHFPLPKTIAVAFLSSFLFFLQLRIADEFKDAEEDARYRPYRPVPRGLVTLRELGIVGGIAAGAQLMLALWLAPGLVLLLSIAWVYLLLMTREFFVSAWLKRRPVHYLWTHMLILPLIDLYVSACDWFPAGGLPSGLAWLLGLSFLNGVVVEIGRKLRSPADEEFGVETYSALWGRTGAIAVWLAAMALGGYVAAMAGRRVGFAAFVVAIAVLVFLTAILCAVRFLRHPEPGRGKTIETMSGIWTTLVYAGCGVVPMLVHAAGAL